MESNIEKIVGLKLKNVHFINDYVQFNFYDRSILNIYNNYDVSNDLSKYAGLNVISVEEQGNFMKINFDKNKSIIIDMREEAYNCPEALALILPSGEIFIWN